MFYVKSRAFFALIYSYFSGCKATASMNSVTSFGLCVPLVIVVVDISKSDSTSDTPEAVSTNSTLFFGSLMEVLAFCFLIKCCT